MLISLVCSWVICSLQLGSEIGRSAVVTVGGRTSSFRPLCSFSISFSLLPGSLPPSLCLCISVAGRVRVWPMLPLSVVSTCRLSSVSPTREVRRLVVSFEPWSKTISLLERKMHQYSQCIVRTYADVKFIKLMWNILCCYFHAFLVRSFRATAGCFPESSTPLIRQSKRTLALHCRSRCSYQTIAE